MCAFEKLDKTFASDLLIFYLSLKNNITYRSLAHDVKTVNLEDNFKLPTFDRAKNK